MLAGLIFLIEGIKDHLQVFFIIEKISIARIYKQRLDMMLLDIIGIGLLDVEQVFIRYVLFITPVPFFDVCLESCDWSMKIDEDVRLDELLVYDLEQTLVETKLIIGQGHLGKQEAFCK